MPNSETNESRFYAFVLTYYRNDPYMMLDKFSSEISAVASQVSIDWEQSRNNVALDGDMVKGKYAIGIEKEDAGRVSIVGFENTHEWDLGEKTYSIKYPSILFKNHRKHFDEPVLFDGYKALMDEYESYKTGVRVTRGNLDPVKQSERLKKIAERGERDKIDQAEAVSKDKRWLKMLSLLEEPCPYFFSKGVPELFQWIPLYRGETTLGHWLGRFTAISLKDIVTWEFRGIQRYYPDIPAKVYRKGLNTTGACVVIPNRMPIDGEPIYVMEAVADSGMSFKLTGCFSVAALYADNIPIIVRELRNRCPNSPIIIVADNDQYPDKNGNVTINKGVDICELTLRNTRGETFMIIPQFEAAEIEKQYKDLTDYCLAYGMEKGALLLSDY